ncbi:MAG: hypothetical protein IJF88_07940, partial [Oscillospiraceae bacterium]|nr:hypothetical protein [Oscillospiraceae bacterium]MBR7056050.1 hypothetical protein [Oscillospiraceae bacterium]
VLSPFGVAWLDYHIIKRLSRTFFKFFFVTRRSPAALADSLPNLAPFRPFVNTFLQNSSGIF